MKPININDQSNRDLVTALVANQTADDDEKTGKVSAKHLRRLAKRFLQSSDVLDKILEKIEKE